MFVDYHHPCLRFTGRFAELDGAMTATAPGSYFELAFEGDTVVLFFDLENMQYPFPHLWMQLDGGSKFEVPIDRFLRVEADHRGKHILTVRLKGEMEVRQRWNLPLETKCAFKGAEIDAPGDLPEDNRKTIEFVGDSITEGVLIDDFRRYSDDDTLNRPFQDDVTATYDYLLADALNWRPLHMGYGAVGVTHGGCGCVPKAAEGYPFCFADKRVTYNHPDYVLINHGANDSWDPNIDNYLTEYRALLDVIFATHPDTQVICVPAFCGFAAQELHDFVDAYNAEKNQHILFIDSRGWVPCDPLHPQRTGHRIIALHLAEELNKALAL